MANQIAKPGEPLPEALFKRVDETDDRLFYQAARMVTHIDDATIAALTQWYSEHLAPGMDLLDLMSSWISHLPETMTFGRVAGLGMNQEELSANGRLTEATVQDLNAEPQLPYDDASFDAVMIVVSIQYLTNPIAVLAQASRVLRPGGRLVIAMSHRMFPTKAIRAFHALEAADRIRLVTEYCRRAGGFGAPEFMDASPQNADPLWIVTAIKR